MWWDVATSGLGTAVDGHASHRIADTVYIVVLTHSLVVRYVCSEEVSSVTSQELFLEAVCSDGTWGGAAGGAATNFSASSAPAARERPVLWSRSQNTILATQHLEPCVQLLQLVRTIHRGRRSWDILSHESSLSITKE